MNAQRWIGMLVLCATACRPASAPAASPAADAVALPAGVQVDWQLSHAWRESTPARQRICINGLWRWQPANPDADRVPDGEWGYFKVPGCWPGITDYMQKDDQTVHAHPRWQDQRLAGVAAAWYQREITIPQDWADRRIAVYLEYLNSYAAVYLDGQQVGEIRFPAGEVDISGACRPGATQILSLLIVPLPLQAVRLSYNDSNSARQVRGSVPRRGLCGDAYLLATPRGPRIEDAQVETSVRRGEITIRAALQDLARDQPYALRATISRDGRELKQIAGQPFLAGDLQEGRIALTTAWQPEELWDTHTPQHQYDLNIRLVDGREQILDAAWPVRFGFREFWIEGRDFYLNGTRIFLCAVPLDNAQIGTAWASYAGARESLQRLQSFGINFVYTHNYSCQPGAHLSFAELLRAADDVGMLVALSQPHFSDYEWTKPDAEQTNGYAQHAEFYVRAAQHHPAVVMYSTSHNATGYSEDMNPDLIDGLYDRRDEWAMNNVRRALRAEAILQRLDPTRTVYHHSSGNLGSMHTSNFYPNFVPVQELSDWFEHWATEGVKPFFACEYGAPFTWDWAMYRGWHQGRREFGSAAVPWEFCLAEWNSQFLGDAAYQISAQEQRNLRWEARQLQAGRLWHRWDYPHQLGSTDFAERYPVIAKYLRENWRAFRTWGVSAISPWEHSVYWKLRPGMDRNRRVELATDWENLQRPGFSPDYLEQRYERMDLAYERGDWIATPAAEALYRNNQPVLVYLAGKPAAFTSQDHNFLPGETLPKQIVVINNSRLPTAYACAWSLTPLGPAAGAGTRLAEGRATLSAEPGQQTRLPLNIQLPEDLPAGTYALDMTASPEPVPSSDKPAGEIQEDRLEIHVLAPPPAPASAAKIALFDPVRETGKLLAAMGIECDSITADADLTGYDLLVIGKAALTAEGPAPSVDRVRQGLRVLVFEQTSAALQNRLGFRVQEYGLRNIFPRVPDHPVLDGLGSEHLRDWRGEATILPPRLDYELSDKYSGSPAVRWCGLEVPRLWRCGNRGNVASVLIEKPACGDFLPIADGGFSLQYSPLLEYREGRGMVLFCQLDVTGRTESDPAASRLVGNLLDYVSGWKPAPRRQALYAGESQGESFWKSAGVPVSIYRGGELTADQVLIVGRGAAEQLAPHAAAVARWLQSGGHLLALDADAAEANKFLPAAVETTSQEHIAACFPPAAFRSLLAGVGPADVHNRDPRSVPLVTGGARPVGNGVLATLEGMNVVFCQLAPYSMSLPENAGRPPEQLNQRRTYRRTAFLVSRLAANLGVSGNTPLLSRISTPVSESSGQDVLRNGAFQAAGDVDEMPAGWQFTASGKAAATAGIVGDAPLGLARSLCLRCPATPADDRRSLMLAQSDVPVQAGQWYRIALWARSEGFEGGSVSLALQNTVDWQSLFDYQRFVPEETWSEFTFLVQAKATATSQTRFQIWHGHTGALWLAGVRMAPCDPPSHGRWTSGLYLDEPQEWDDPYRFFRW